MSQVDYAFIKNGEVVNVVVFEDSVTEETLEHFKNEFDVDILIPANEKTAMGSTFDGTKFWLPKPYPSWIKNEESNEWEAPVSYPDDENVYVWNEVNKAWDLSI